MALIPLISCCTLDCCKYLKVSDVTGAYNAVSNLGGWGTPNLDLTAVTDASLTIIYPDGSTDIIDSTDAVRYPVLMTNITTASAFPFELYTFVPLTGTTFPDGVTEIDYMVTDGTDVYTTSIYSSSDCNISCCVDNMFAQLPSKMCNNCDYDIFVQNALQARALLKAYRCNCCCGNWGNAMSILVQLQKLCDWADCNCGQTNSHPHHHHHNHHPHHH